MGIFLIRDLIGTLYSRYSRSDFEPGSGELKLPEPPPVHFSFCDVDEDQAKRWQVFLRQT